MAIPVTPPQPQASYYDPASAASDLPVQMECIPDPGSRFMVSLISGLAQGWQANVLPFPPPGITHPVYTPPGPLGSTQGQYVVVPVGFAVKSIDSVTATENTDGSGESVDLTSKTNLMGPQGPISPGAIPTYGVMYFGPVWIQIMYDIPVPPAAVVQSIRITGYRLYRLDPYTPPGNPPPTTTGGGTGGGLEKANPGFTAEVERSVIFWDDLVSVFLGDRVNLTVESEGSRLGFAARGHIINKVDLNMRSSLSGGQQTETIDWVYTLEKIPGTLLPGAGTSSPSQDALGGGAELPAFLTIETAGTGIEMGGLA